MGGFRGAVARRSRRSGSGWAAPRSAEAADCSTTPAAEEGRGAALLSYRDAAGPGSAPSESLRRGIVEASSRRLPPCVAPRRAGPRSPSRQAERPRTRPSGPGPEARDEEGQRTEGEDRRCRGQEGDRGRQVSSCGRFALDSRAGRAQSRPRRVGPARRVSPAQCRGGRVARGRAWPRFPLPPTREDGRYGPGLRVRRGSWDKKTPHPGGPEQCAVEVEGRQALRQGAARKNNGSGHEEEGVGLRGMAIPAHQGGKARPHAGDGAAETGLRSLHLHQRPPHGLGSNP